ncbi:nitroreductase family protein [Microbacterium sp. ARD31]|jgi:nitroreductase|uniref:nitroreductase family protein n=1 Tax=unclassified Microbacterium TaxID=2609290 RepID=UPI0020401190|nr:MULTISPECIES: nitroreductase family protein [unclassified Microbacterium]MDT0184808.1 nitroreductase family protein [Microbacterium sp. ARD31]
MTTAIDRTADTDAPILDVLAERWSTRIFDAHAPIDESALASALEAARWTPTAANLQPWRLIVARRGTDQHARIVETLAGFNSAWAGDAAVLVVFIAETERDGQTLDWAVYDTGQVAAHFTIQAHANGLSTHQMGGFDRAALSQAFELAPELTPVTIAAVGELGDIRAASDELQARENAPRTRRSLDESVLVDA